MDKGDLISVVIPVYNVGLYLERCLNSVVYQTYTNLEIVLIDDGSTDESGLICDEWAQKDNRIRVIHKKNGGLSDARNYGIKEAHGDYLMFVDSDDAIALSMIQKVLTFRLLPAPMQGQEEQTECLPMVILLLYQMSVMSARQR